MENKEVVQAGVVIASVSAISEATLALLRSLGYLDDSTVNAFAVFFKLVIPPGVTLWMMWWLSKRTTSLEKPKDSDGELLVRKDTGGPTLYQEKKELDRSIQEQETT